jgi:N-acetylmuramoyl-L-alanine amidase
VLIIVKVSLFSNVYAQKEEQYTLKTVVIDAGHGGKDPGTNGKYAKEKDIALAIALKLGTYIEENIPDIKVIYTRTTDIFVPLNERADIANKNNADLFISIHLNGNKDSRAYGTETYAMGLHKTEGNLEVAKLENSAILFEEDYSTQYEGFDPKSAESYIIFSFLQNTSLEQSLNYAAFIEHEFKNKALRKSRGVKQAGFLVLWKTTMPSVLIEAGFLTNSREERYLSSTEGQEYIASAIYRAFKNYKTTIEEKSHFITNIETTIIQEDTSKILFKVQIASSKNSVQTNPDSFKGLKNVEEIKINDTYKYTVGSFTNYTDIVKYKKSIEEVYPDAFIIAVEKEGNLVPLNEAIKINQN